MTVFCERVPLPGSYVLLQQAQGIRITVFVVVVSAHTKYKVNGVQHQEDKNHNNKKESADSFLWEGSSTRF